MDSQDFFYKTLGDAIRRAREQRGISQSALAATIGLGRTSITNIEQGRQKLLLHTAYDIALALHVTLADLLPQESVASPADFASQLPAGLSVAERAFIEVGIRRGKEG
jgi:transcriptional regulator with XRE-family HTH domain